MLEAHLVAGHQGCDMTYKLLLNCQGNAPVERSHNTFTTCLFKLTGDVKGTWPQYVPAVLFAMHMTVSRSTRYSPFYLLYGQHPVFSFDAEEVTWQTLKWNEVHSHEELIAMCACQILRHGTRMHTTNYGNHARGRLMTKLSVINTSLTSLITKKGCMSSSMNHILTRSKAARANGHMPALTSIHEKRDNDSFILRELSGAVMCSHVNIHCL